MNEGLVSIIIPIYNAGEYLDQCLRTIQNQTYNEFEVLMINDGSSDESEKIAKRYQLHDQRFRYYYQKNIGPSGARNKGLDLFNGEFITFVDADDWLETDYLEIYVSRRNEVNADIVFGGYSKNGQCIKNYVKKESSLISYRDNLVYGTGGCVCGKLYLSKWLKNHRFELDICMREDLLFGLDLSRILPSNIMVSYIDYCGYHYRTVDNSLTKSVRGLDSSNGSVLKIMERLCNMSLDKKALSDFIKNIVFWDCIALSQSGKSLSEITDSYFFEKYKKYMIITTLKDKIYFSPLCYGHIYMANLVYLVYGKVRK